MPDALSVTPLTSPLDATVRPPGSKSITNRALICAALAPGVSTLTGALFADDTKAMLDAVAALGATVSADPSKVTVTGADLSKVAATDRTIDARQSGTTSRFILPAAVRGPLRGGRVAVSGHISSQFLSGLLLAGPLMAEGLTVE